MSRKTLLILSMLIIGTLLSSSVVVGYTLSTQENIIWSSLTNEQKQAIILKIQEMKNSGATRREIMLTILSMLQEWGIQMPKLGFMREYYCNRLLRHKYNQ